MRATYGWSSRLSFKFRAEPKILRPIYSGFMLSHSLKQSLTILSMFSRSSGVLLLSILEIFLM